MEEETSNNKLEQCMARKIWTVQNKSTLPNFVSFPSSLGIRPRSSLLERSNLARNQQGNNTWRKSDHFSQAGQSLANLKHTHKKLTQLFK